MIYKVKYTVDHSISNRGVSARYFTVYTNVEFMNLHEEISKLHTGKGSLCAVQGNPSIESVERIDNAFVVSKG